MEWNIIYIKNIINKFSSNVRLIMFYPFNPKILFVNYKTS